VSATYIYTVGLGPPIKGPHPFVKVTAEGTLAESKASWCRSGTNSKVLHTGVTSFVSHWPFVSCLCGVAVCVVTLFHS
jgi:hypothetical protein